MDEKNIIEKLIQKSIESFTVGIELYNKPTIKYRVEGFSFFACNAWELLLKAYLVKRDGESSIYYSDKSGRTKSLEVCIRLVFTNDKDPLRRNLESIVSLRNTSTHYITEDYEQIYAPLFQSCVLNYRNTLLRFFGIDIADRLNLGFLTIAVKVPEIDKTTLHAKYSKPIADKLLSTLASIQHETQVNENPAYAVQVEHNLYITKNKSSADISVSLSKGGKEAAVIIKERRDRQRECPFRMKECLKQINQIISKEGINFINPAHIDNQEKIHLFNSFVFNLFVKFYQMKNEERYCYCYDVNKNPTYTYSQAAIDFILEQIKKAPEHIFQELKDKIKS